MLAEQATNASRLTALHACHFLLLLLISQTTSLYTPATPLPQLEAIINDKVKEEAPLFGFEQEYTMLAKGGHIYGERGAETGGCAAMHGLHWHSSQGL